MSSFVPGGSNLFFSLLELMHRYLLLILYIVPQCNRSKAANDIMGVTTEDIIKAANWNSESVFRRVISNLLELLNSQYGRAVLVKRHHKKFAIIVKLALM